MIKSRVNGYSIEDYWNERAREADRPVIEVKPVVLNGYAPNDFIVDSSLVLYLPLWALKGSPIKSVDRYGHSCSVTGATWTLEGRTLDGDDKIDCGSASALTMGTSDQTVAIWVKLAADDDNAIIGSGATGTTIDGWRLRYLTASDYMYFYIWCFCGF